MSISDPRSINRIELKIRLMDDNGEERSLSLVPGASELEHFVHILEGAVNTYYSKNKTYGSVWRQQGWMGNLARIQSKVGRLRSMLWRDEPVEGIHEPVQDTLQDLINLAVFMQMNLGQENRWGS